MAKFNEKSFNGQAFGKYVDRIPNTKRNELIKSKALKSNEQIRETFSSQTGTGYAVLPFFGLLDGSISCSCLRTKSFSNLFITF